MQQKTERVPVMFDKPLLDHVDDFMFSNRIRNRSEVIRRLVRVGLEYSDAPVERPAVVAAE